MIKNYLEQYASKPVKKLQAGGMGVPAAAPEQGGGQVEQMLMQVIQTQDPNMALQFCNMLAEQMGVGGQPQSAPAPATEGLPAGKYGMSTKKLIKKPASIK